jgi:hypothetical protein
VNLNKNDVEFLLPDTTFYCEAPAGIGSGGGRGEERDSTPARENEKPVL